MSPALAPTETYVSCLTPSGTGAIATLAVRGPRAWEVLRDLFRPHSRSQSVLPGESVIGPIWLGRLGAELADEAVLTVKAVNPVPWLEVHCHGGREVIRLLLEAFAARGIATCTWQQLEAATNPDPLRAQAAAELVKALTFRTSAILLDQYQGALGRTLAVLSEALLRADHADALRLLEELRQQTNVGRHLTAPWRVVVAGAPNVGKSSLVNALAGYQRCVVAPTPGTTRDVVTTLLAVGGWPVELADTAGLRTDAESLEEQGIELARSAAAAADLCLWVLDASAAPIWPALDFARTASLKVVINKVDLRPAWNLAEAPDALRISARTGDGFESLCAKLSEWLVPVPPTPGAAVPFTAVLCERIEEACRHGAANQWCEALSVLKRIGEGQ